MILFTKTNKPTKKLNDTVTEIISIDTQIKQLKARADILKADLKTSIETSDTVGSISTDTFTVTYRKSSTTRKIDTKTFKANDIKTYEKYLISSDVKSSISVKSKG